MELPVITLIQTVLAEVDSSFETRQGTAFYDLFVKPQQLMLQPLIDYTAQARVGQSVKLILGLSSPDSFSTDFVDNLVSNFYITRDQGALATATVRVYYSKPLAKQFPAQTAEFLTSTGLSFFNSADISITSVQMSIQNDGNLYYIDVPVIAQNQDASYNVAENTITTILNDSDAVLVTNLSAAIGGLTAETNTQVLTRTANSISVRDLETVKGINAILTQTFPFIQQIQAIGMGDPEMQRDILYNAHVGGKTDVYLKTPTLTSGSFNALGLDYDLTREVHRNYHMQVAKSAGDSQISSDVGTPNIVIGSTTITEDVIQTSASITSLPISSGSGVDLTGAEWLRIQIDSLADVQVKVSGANVAQTQIFEIINSINSAFGYTVAAAAAGNRFTISSLTSGAGSQVILQTINPPVASSQYAGNALFGVSSGSLPYAVYGSTATEYIEGIDYTVDTVNGLIYQKPFTSLGRDPYTNGRQTITSGQTMISGASDGQVTKTGSVYYLSSSTASKFLNQPIVKVRPGDEVTITSIGGLTTGTVLGNLPQTFIVSSVVSTTQLGLSGFNPSGVTAIDSVTYSIVSSQVVIVNYKYNPVSVDIGPQVLLPNGYDRGVRPGRTPFTIQDVPFINITSIEPIDPDSLEVIGAALNPPSGFGAGGFGTGGFGVGTSGDYNFLVNSPTERFSVYEDSMILFTPAALTSSYVVKYKYVPELVAVHNLTRNDTERVTGADVLPKNYVPGLVDVTIGIRRDPTNLTTPSNDALGVLVANLINASPANKGLNASDIIKMLEAEGVASVKTPFTMKCTVLNTDGSTSIVQSQDVLTFPAVTLASQADNFVTARIVHFYPNNVSVIEVA